MSLRTSEYREVTSPCPDCGEGTITETYYRHPEAPFFPEVDPCEVCGAEGPFPPDEFPEDT
jgi:hypothetical protein